MTRAPIVGWTAPETVAAFAGWAALSASFLVIELRSRSPLVHLDIFRKRTLTGANVIGLFLGTAIFGMFYLLSLYMQQVLGFSAMKTGVAYLAVALTAVVASGAAQAVVTRFGVKPALTFGLLMLAGGLAYFTQISVGGSYVSDLLPGFLAIGVGLGFSFVPISIAALAGVDGPDAGLASGLINTNQQIGGALGLAILTTVSTTRTDNLIGDGIAQPQALTDGFSLAFWVSIGFTVVGILTTLVVLRRDDMRVGTPEVEPAGAPIN